MHTVLPGPVPRSLHSVSGNFVGAVCCETHPMPCNCSMDRNRVMRFCCSIISDSTLIELST